MRLAAENVLLDIEASGRIDVVTSVTVSSGSGLVRLAEEQ